MLIVPARGQMFGTEIDNITAAFSDEGILVPNGASVTHISLEDCGAEEDEATVALLDKYQAELATALNVIVGSIAEALNSSHAEASIAFPPNSDGSAGDGCILIADTEQVFCGCGVASCKQGAFVADAMRFAAAAADFSVTNAGSVRSELPSGEVSRGQLSKLLPFANELVLVKVSGAILKSMLSHSLTDHINRSDTSDHFISGRFLQCSSTLRWEWSFLRGVPIVKTVSVWERNADGCSSSETDPTSDARNATADHVCWRPLNETRVYSMVVDDFILGGGDEYTMLTGLGGVQLAISASDAAAAYLAAYATVVEIGEWANRTKQLPDVIEIEVGLLCQTFRVNDPEGNVSSLEREECDHFYHMLDLLNDKSDGFMDELLPDVKLVPAEAYIGCNDGLGPSAVANLSNQLPNMIAALGPTCSDDASDITNDAFRASASFDAVHIASISTAPSLANETAFPKLARLVTTDVSLTRGFAFLAERWKWTRVAVINDDSLWAREAGPAFALAHQASHLGISPRRHTPISPCISTVSFSRFYPGEHGGGGAESSD